MEINYYDYHALHVTSNFTLHCTARAALTDVVGMAFRPAFSRLAGVLHRVSVLHIKLLARIDCPSFSQTTVRSAKQWMPVAMVSGRVLCDWSEHVL